MEKSWSKPPTRLLLEDGSLEATAIWDFFDLFHGNDDEYIENKLATG